MSWSASATRGTVSRSRISPISSSASTGSRNRGTAPAVAPASAWPSASNLSRPTAAASPHVSVQTDGPAGHAVLRYARHDEGSLTCAGTYATGGNGARPAGAAVDPLASRGGRVYGGNHRLLRARHAGSNTVSVFG